MIERAGIFGPTLSGKTTLAKSLSLEFWTKHKLKTLVLDPRGDNWGAHALVFTTEEKFWPTVWASQWCVVIVEEATETINRRNDLNSVFTAIRHQHHKLIVVGHNGTSLNPIMRQQLETLFLFRQSPKAAKIWIEETACEELEAASQMNQYEFLYYRRFQPIKKLRLAPP